MICKHVGLSFQPVEAEAEGREGGGDGPNVEEDQQRRQDVLGKVPDLRLPRGLPAAHV